MHQILRICSSYTTETLQLFRSKPLSPVPEALTSTVAVFTCVIITNILHKTGLMRYLSFCVYLISFRTICEVFLFSGPVNDFCRRIVPLTSIFHTLDILILHMTLLFDFLRQSLIELSWPRVWNIGRTWTPPLPKCCSSRYHVWRLSYIFYCKQSFLDLRY